MGEPKRPYAGKRWNPDRAQHRRIKICFNILPGEREAWDREAERHHLARSEWMRLVLNGNAGLGFRALLMPQRTRVVEAENE